MLEETQWLTSKLTLADERPLELLSQTNGLLCSVHLKINNGGRKIISLIDTDNKAFWGIFGWFDWQFSSYNKDKTASTSFLTVLSGRITVLPTVLLFICFKCYLTCMISSKDVYHHQRSVVCSGSFPFIRFHCDLLDRPSSEKFWLLSLNHGPFFSSKQLKVVSTS